MDLADRAHDNEELFRHHAVLYAQSANTGLGPVYIDGIPTCLECGCEIPIARITLLPKTSYCVGCASYLQTNRR